MTLLLLIILILAETGFMVFELTRKSSKKTWTTKRILVNAAELIVFFAMVLLPGIDTGKPAYRRVTALRQFDLLFLFRKRRVTIDRLADMKGKTGELSE